MARLQGPGLASPYERLLEYGRRLPCLLDSLVKQGRRGDDGLARVPSSESRTLAAFVEKLDVFGYIDAETVDSWFSPSVWKTVLELHAMAVRQLVGLRQSDSDKVERVETVLACTHFLFIKTDVFRSAGDIGGRLALALIRTDTLHCYAKLMALWKDVPVQALEPKLRLMAQVSLIFSSVAQVAVSSDDTASMDLYTEYIRALGTSQLLEHMSQALLRVHESAVAANARGEVDQAVAQNIRRGVLETCCCIVSALHGIAGHRSILDCSWRTPSWLAPTEAGRKGQVLLPEVRAVLSGPCLQFLLGKEVVSSTLQLDVDRKAFGMPAAYLPGHLGNPPPRTAKELTDRLLSQLSAAALVWQITTMGTAAETAAPAAPAAAAGAAEYAGHQPHATQPSAMPYHAVNVYDMIFQALSCVMGTADTEHLAGGCRLTLIEPVLLAVRLAREMPRRYMRTRLPFLWGAIVLLLQRPKLHLDYDSHRPLVQIGSLLGLQVEAMPRPAGEAPAAPAASSSSAAVVASERTAVTASPVPPMEAAAAAAAPAPTVLYALGCDLLPTLEALMRLWARGTKALLPDEASVLAATNHLLRRPGTWPTILAHGSFRQLASLIVTLRRVAEKFKSCRIATTLALAAVLKDQVSDPGKYADGEIAITAYQAALLEQLAAMILPPVAEPVPITGGGAGAAAVVTPPAAAADTAVSSSSPSSSVGTTALAAGSDPACSSPASDSVAAAPSPPGRCSPEVPPGPSGALCPLALNNALEADRQPMDLEWMVRAGGCPPVHSRAALGQRLMAVFCLTQWLPEAFWLAPLLDTWFSAQFSGAVLRWVLEAALQCRMSQMDPAHIDLGKPGREYDAFEAEKEAGGLEGGIWRGPAASTAAGSAAADVEAAALAAAAQSSRFMHWSAFLMNGLDVLSWCGVFFGSSPDDEEERRRCARTQAAVMPLVLDVLEVVAVALPKETCRATVKVGGKEHCPEGLRQQQQQQPHDQRPRQHAGQQQPSKQTRRVGLERATQAGSNSNSGSGVASGSRRKRPPGAGAAAGAGTGAGAGVSAGAPHLQRAVEQASVRAEEEVEALRIVVDDQLRRHLRQHGRNELLAVLELWAEQPHVYTDTPRGCSPLGGSSSSSPRPAATSNSTGPTGGRSSCSGGSDTNCRGGGSGDATNDSSSLVDGSSSNSSSSTTVCNDDGAASSNPAGCDSTTATNTKATTTAASPMEGTNGDDAVHVEVDSSSVGDVAGQDAAAAGETRRARVAAALRALSEMVHVKHGLTHRPILPSPFTAAATAAMAGVELCDNPGCCNLEGPSAAALSARKVCSRCRARSYCSGACQLAHWNGGHAKECPVLVAGLGAAAGSYKFLHI